MLCTVSVECPLAMYRVPGTWWRVDMASILTAVIVYWECSTLAHSLPIELLMTVRYTLTRR